MPQHVHHKHLTWGHLISSSYLTFILYWSIVIYSIVLVSGVQQSDLVMHIHVSILSDSFPIWLITEYWVEFPMLYGRSLLVICFIYRSCCYLVAKSYLNLFWPHGWWPARLLCPWDFPGKNTRVGFHVLLQRIFLTQGSKLHLLCGRQILYHGATREAHIQ